MGRAIVREPKVFLMDEPLSNLDAKLRVQTRSQIAELQRRLGVTTVYVTHDQVEAMTMGHRVAVLSNGKLQQCASPRELYDNPVNQFVAGFIGSPAMNLLTAPLTDGGAAAGGDGHPAQRGGAGRGGAGPADRARRRHQARAPAPGRRGRQPDGWPAAAGGQRRRQGRGGSPRAERRGAAGGGARRRRADARPAGREGDSDGGTVVARTEGRKSPAPGQRVTFRVQPDDVFAFHPETGARLAG